MSSRVSRKSGLKLFIASCIFAYICLFIKWSWLCWVCAFHFGFGSCTVAFLLPLLTITLVVQVWYMIWLTLNMGRSDVNCKGNVSKFHVVWRVVTLNKLRSWSWSMEIPTSLWSSRHCVQDQSYAGLWDRTGYSRFAKYKINNERCNKTKKLLVQVAGCKNGHLPNTRRMSV